MSLLATPFGWHLTPTDAPVSTETGFGIDWELITSLMLPEALTGLWILEVTATLMQQ